MLCLQIHGREGSMRGQLHRKKSISGNIWCLEAHLFGTEVRKGSDSASTRLGWKECPERGLLGGQIWPASMLHHGEQDFFMILTLGPSQGSKWSGSLPGKEEITWEYMCVPMCMVCVHACTHVCMCVWCVHVCICVWCVHMYIVWCVWCVHVHVCVCASLCPGSLGTYKCIRYNAFNFNALFCL